MKVRDSGMPEEATWKTFFDAGEILAALAFADVNADVIDFGCGYGTFTVAAEKIQRPKSALHACFARSSRATL